MSKITHSQSTSYKTIQNIKNKFDSGDFEEYKALSYAYVSADIQQDVTDLIENGLGGFIHKKNVDGDFKVKYKTEICKFWELNKICKYGDNCAFAHGMNDIRGKASTTSNYKTKKCKQFYESGYCPYGLRCQFLHLQQLSFGINKTFYNNTTNSDAFFSYRKTIQRLLNLDQGSIQSLFYKERSRLRAFSSLTITSSDNKSFYEDIIDIKSTEAKTFDLTENYWTSQHKISSSEEDDPKLRLMTI